MARFDPEDIRRYYDRHTPSFVALGQGGSAGAIRRAVWGPGVRDRRQAFRYVDDLIAERIQELPQALESVRVVDLGCGVGASLCYLATRLPIRATGITLSPVQARLAAHRVRKAGLVDRVVCLEGDYCDIPKSVGHADLAYAIESFVHGPAPERFFAQCRQLVRPGGVLVICDDVLRPTLEPDAPRTIERFCNGWRVNSLVQSGELESLARATGFERESTIDLSPYLELRRARDRIIDAFLAGLARLRLDMDCLAPLHGGSALQTCIERGWVGYELAVFRRLPALGPALP